MRQTVSMWMLIGLAVACCWAVVGLLIGPTSYNLGHSTVVVITAPASLVGRKMPLGVVWFVLLNGGIYALVGLAIELIRRAHQNQEKGHRNIG
jgi:hypothetical protein